MRVEERIMKVKNTFKKMMHEDAAVTLLQVNEAPREETADGGDHAEGDAEAVVDRELVVNAVGAAVWMVRKVSTCTIG